MTITVSDMIIERIMRMVLNNEPHQKVSLELITESFLKFAVQFFKDVVLAKCDGRQIDIEWYKRYFLQGDFSAKDTIIYAGLNEKTVTNIYGGKSERLVFDITPSYHDELIDKIEALVNSDISDLEINLAIKYRDVSVNLSLSETLIVVNTLGAKRAQIRGGIWSSIGKRFELRLMVTLAKLYQVPHSHYAGKGLTGEFREVDFHFLNSSGYPYYCEVKLMGKGNPEGADNTVARESDILIAHTISDRMKHQLNERSCRWVELRESEGYKKIYEIFEEWNIPCVEFVGELNPALDRIIPEVFAEVTM